MNCSNLVSTSNTDRILLLTERTTAPERSQHVCNKCNMSNFRVVSVTQSTFPGSQFIKKKNFKSVKLQKVYLVLSKVGSDPILQFNRVCLIYVHEILAVIFA